MTRRSRAEKDRISEIKTIASKLQKSTKSRKQVVAIEVEDGVLFKRVEIPDVKIEFEALSRDIAPHFKKYKIKKSDVADAVKWARGEQR